MMKVLKFGGKSLANGEGLAHVLNIFKNKIKNNEHFITVVSARGNATDTLQNILELAKQKKDYQKIFEDFKNYQLNPRKQQDFSEEFLLLKKIFEGVYLLGDFGEKVKDLVLAQGEILSAKILVALLKDAGIDAAFVDSRQILKTDENFGNANLLEEISLKNTQTFFKKIPKNKFYILTGFIAATENNTTTTLGSNGSNYSASLFANYLGADLLENYTHVKGIYTADPHLVANAQKIKHLSFSEARDLARLGTKVLNAKAMVPLIEKNIPMKVLSTFFPEKEGTLISKNGDAKGGVKAVSILNDRVLLTLEGKGLLGKVGIDGRVFHTLRKQKISVSIISQCSSERGLSFVIQSQEAEKAKKALLKEFELDFTNKDIHKITLKKDIVVISTLGKNLASFKNSYNSLINNNIEPILMNNTAGGNDISLVVKKEDFKKAVHVIHGEIFGINKNINIAIFGVGLVGGTLIKQMLRNKKTLLKQRNINLNIFAVARSNKLLLQEKGIDENWQEKLQKSSDYQIKDVIDFALQHNLENLIAVDNTASQNFTEHYISLVKNGFNLVSSNKIANTLSFDFYNALRIHLKKNKKKYLYETNVGAGLPLIDTISLLHQSGENITRIKGVFSGTLSYLFNQFSVLEKSFSAVLSDAIEKGYTEPDPREDLNGNDVARKLLILARELDLKNEFEEVAIENLIPEKMRTVKTQDFLNHLKDLDAIYKTKKQAQKQGNVLRYIGDLQLKNTQNEKGTLQVKLVSVPSDSSLGQVKGADSIFEIYTESYRERPLVIQGAGAGAAVTARGVFGDILRLITL